MRMSFENWAENELQVMRSSVAVQKPTQHTSMYKYISLDNKKSWNYFDTMLNENKLYGATLKSLNDPYEGSPSLVDDLNSSTIKKMDITNLQHKIKGMNGDFIPNYEDLEVYRLKAKNYLSGLLDSYRVLAFCERADSPLLWSHYANSYKGACLHFLGRAFDSRPYQAKLGYVTYSNHRPHLPLSLALGMANHKRLHMRHYNLGRAELEKFCFFTKGLDWKYENEIRAIYNSNQTTNVKFQPDGLISITLGPKMAEADKDRVIKKVTNSQFSQITIKDAKLSENTFSVNSD